MLSKTKLVTSLKQFSLTVPTFIFLVLPASTNYTLKSYELGAGGRGDSANFSSLLQNEVSGENGASTNFNSFTGLSFGIMANVPGSPTVTNASGTDYNKLTVVINNGSNPTDATFAIAASTSSTFSSISYVQADGTLSSAAVYQTYTNWGSGTGTVVIGLAPGTTYYFKVKATQGSLTESPYSASANAATVTPTLTFDLDVGSTNSVDTSGPYTVSLGSLTAGNVITATNQIWIDLDTNAATGGVVYVKDSNNGLSSAHTGTTITSATANLTAASSGYGFQDTYKSQSSGGPFAYITPYDGTSNSVGLLNSTYRKIFDSTGTPVVGGRGGISVMAKASSTTPASTDYTDTVTIVAAGSF